MNKSLLGGSILILFLLTACNFGSEELVCTTGTQGILASFDRSSMRTSYDEGISVPIVVDIANRGAYPTTGIVRLNYNKDLISVANDEINFTIDGKARYNQCTGVLEKHQFFVQPYTLQTAVQNFDTRISLDVCYGYKTELNTTICADAGIAIIAASDRICRPATRTYGGGQGSPLSVVRVEAPSFLQDGSLLLRIYLRNNGVGTILAGETAGVDESSKAVALQEACSISPQASTNYVHIKGFLDGNPIECYDGLPADARPENKVLLRYDPTKIVENDREIILRDYYVSCIVRNLGLTREREMNLNIEFNYFYRDAQSDARTITLRKV